MSVRWWPDGPVMADGVYKRENSHYTTEIDRLDKVQDTENRRGFRIPTLVWSSEVSGEDVVHSRQHPQAEEGRPRLRQLLEAGDPRGNMSLSAFPSYKGQFGKEKQEEEQ